MSRKKPIIKGKSKDKAVPPGSIALKQANKKLESVEDVTESVKSGKNVHQLADGSQPIVTGRVSKSRKTLMRQKRVATKSGTFFVPNSKNFLKGEFRMSGHKLINSEPVQYYDQDIDLVRSILKEQTVEPTPIAEVVVIEPVVESVDTDNPNPPEDGNPQAA